jgi:hypothetical protein
VSVRCGLQTADPTKQQLAAVWHRRDRRAKVRPRGAARNVVADFFALVDTPCGDPEITPRVRALRGVLAGSGLDESDYRRQLEETYR